MLVALERAGDSESHLNTEGTEKGNRTRRKNRDSAQRRREGAEQTGEPSRERRRGRSECRPQHREIYGRANTYTVSEATMATYCLPFLPAKVMGFALASFSSLVTHSSLPVFESKARKRWSEVAPMKTRPPAVVIGPALPPLPVFCLPSGRPSVMPERGLPRDFAGVAVDGGQASPRRFLAGPVAEHFACRVLAGSAEAGIGAGAYDAGAVIFLGRAFRAAAVNLTGFFLFDPAH